MTALLLAIAAVARRLPRGVGYPLAARADLEAQRRRNRVRLSG